MTKTLGSAALQLYAGVAAMFLPIENQPGLIADLMGDPFVGHTLSSATCELYHRYGMFLAPLTAVLTTLKHAQFGHCCLLEYTMADTKQENQEMYTQAEEPAQSSVERVTDPKQKVKDKKKVAAGHAGAAARKAKQEERLLEQLRAAKESLRPPASDGRSTNIPPKEADQEQAVSADKRPEHNREGLTNWTPWIVGACLRGGALMFLRNTQTRSHASVAAGPIDSALKQPVGKLPGAKQLKTSPDPFYME